MQPKRKHIRLKKHNYNSGLYFVTICTQNKVHYLGEIRNQKIHLSMIGEKLLGILSKYNNEHNELIIWSYCIMPNHFHALIEINFPDKETDDDVTTTHKGTRRTRLSVWIGEIKSRITKFAKANGYKEFGWQSRYNDHIIRNMNE